MAEMNYGAAAQTTYPSMVSAEIGEKAEFSKREILQHFAQHDLMDELLICNKYLDYYNAVKAVCGHSAWVCRSMAKDEWTHAKAQRDCLLKNGYSMTEEGEAKYHETKKRIEETFR